MASIKPTTVPTKRLAASITGSSTTFTLNNITGWDGNDLTSADFGSKAYGAFRDPTNTILEVFEFDPTTIASGAISFIRRGLKFTGDLTTEVSGNKLTWIRNTTQVELGTDIPQLLAHYLDDLADQSVAGKKTFSTIPASTDTPVATTDLATKAYVDAAATGAATYDQNIILGVLGETVASAGLVCYLKTSDGKWYKADSSDATKSIGVQLAIAQASGTSGTTIHLLIAGRDKSQSSLTIGATYYLSTSGAISTSKGTFVRVIGRVPYNTATDLIVHSLSDDANSARVDGSRNYIADTGAADAYVMTLVPAITAYQAGQVFSFKAANANATTTPTVNINGLGAKTIVKPSGALVANDIITNQIVMIEYDGTNFVMISPSSIAPAGAKFGGTGTDGALSITSGTTTLSCSSLGYLEKNYTSISITGTGNLAFSSPNNTTGTTVALRSQGNVTITTSSTHAIDMRSMGGGPGNAYVLADSVPNLNNSNGQGGAGGSSCAGQGGFSTPAVASSGSYLQFMIAAGMLPPLSPYVRYAPPGGNGSSGGTGGNNGFSSGSPGGGGLGAGGLYIECGGAYNFTTGAIDLSGATGTNSPNNGSGGAQGGSGGGGAGGNILVLYASLTADSGTYNVTGGNGGSHATSGNTGANGASLRAQNKHFV